MIRAVQISIMSMPLLVLFKSAQARTRNNRSALALATPQDQQFSTRRMFGAVVGDTAGSTYEVSNYKSEHCKIFAPRSPFTDEVATDLQWALDEAKESASVTHNHPEGVKGAQSVVAGIFLARTGKSKEEIKTYITQTFE
jgi:hypothetical protein